MNRELEKLGSKTSKGIEIDTEELFEKIITKKDIGDYVAYLCEDYQFAQVVEGNWHIWDSERRIHFIERTRSVFGDLELIDNYLAEEENNPISLEEWEYSYRNFGEE